jgi:uncharacterized tellurite resistance protein B-like protein
MHAPPPLALAEKPPIPASMFDALLRLLTSQSPARLPEPDERLAMAALLVRLARSDGTYAESEISRIDRVLGAQYALAPFAAAALRTQAEVLEANAPDTVRFTRALKDAVPLEERAGLMEALWSVALADADRDASEDTMMRMVARLLGLSDRDSALARQRAERT